MIAGGPLSNDVKRCRSCGADIVFLATKKSRMPVNVVPTEPGFRGPNAGEISFVYGEHQSHFATCPNAQEHRR